MTGEVATMERVLWRDCEQCGKPFVQERRRGRPRVTCSDDCRALRGPHGGLRLARGASSGGGVVVTIWSERHSTHDATGAILAEAFGGDFESGEAPGMGFEGYKLNEKGQRVAVGVTRELKRAAERERKASGDIAVMDTYGLEPARDEGRTCPRITHVIGQSLPWDWQDAA